MIARIATSSIVTANGTALAYNLNRVGGFIQNLSTEVLYVKKGTNASDTVFSAILEGASTTDAPDGGSFLIGFYVGPVSIFGVSTTPRAVVTEDVA